MKIQALAALPLLALIATPAFAACEFDIDVQDNMLFSVQEMEVSASCETVTVNLTHKGNLPAVAMGHNWVLTRTEDVQGVAMDGIAAGLTQDYLKPDDARVIAATKIIGGGDSTSVTFSLEGLDPSADYQYFCSFPGHWSMMKGTFRII
jgi:azurin